MIQSIITQLISKIQFFSYQLLLYFLRKLSCHQIILIFLDENRENSKSAHFLILFVHPLSNNYRMLLLFSLFPINLKRTPSILPHSHIKIPLYS